MIFSLTFIVLSHLFWLLAYIPMLPTTAVELGLAFWILLPNNSGEKAVYGLFSNQFIKFEDSVTQFKHMVFDAFLFRTLYITSMLTDYCSTRISSKKLLKCRQMTEQMDKVI